MKVAYIRVSTIEQNECRQLEAMKNLEIEKYLTEKVSAKDTNRPKLKELMEFVQERDSVYIKDFSRLARSTKDLLELVEYFNAKKVNLIFLNENLDTSTPTGKLMVITMMGAINEFERTNLLERQREGIDLVVTDIHPIFGNPFQHQLITEMVKMEKGHFVRLLKSLLVMAVAPGFNIWFL